MKIAVMRFIFIVFCPFYVAFAAGGGGGGGQQLPDYVCLGWGDGQNSVPVTKYYEEGKRYNDSSGLCQNHGCYVNCLTKDVYMTEISNLQGGKESIFELHSSSPKITFKKGVGAESKANYWCNADTQSNKFCDPSSNTTNYADEAIACKYCGQRSFTYRSGSGTIDPPQPPVPSDLIVEEANFFGTKPVNLIYTRTTGAYMKLRIFHKNSSGQLGSGLNSASCTIFYEGKQAYSGNAYWNLWSGGGAYIFETSDALTKSGQYAVECSGVDKQGQSLVSDRLPFYVAPARYDIGLKIAANGQEYNAPTKAGNSNGSIVKIELIDTLFPVAKVGEEIGLFVNGRALAYNGSVDSGVNTSMSQKGSIKNVIDGLNSQSGARVCVAGEPQLPTSSSSKFSSGILSGTKTTSLTFSDVYKGKMTITYTDEDMRRIIDTERVRGGCSGLGVGNGECPVPPEFEFTFPYLVVPHNFQVAVKNYNGSDIKVLYYGQGSTPENEGKSKLEVTPLNASGSPLNNFIHNCAAIDTDLELNGQDVSITFIDPNNPSTSSTTTTIYAKDFKSGAGNTAIADLDRVISVKRTNGGTWSAEMVAEPTFLAAVKPLMYFTGQKDNPMYPRYDSPVFNSFGNTVILRGRINMVDADNAGDYTKMPTSRVYYEFYCQTCSLTDVGKITGVNQYKRSATSQGWWLDSTFAQHNSSSIKTDNISVTPTGLSVSSVSNFADGMQTLSYQNAGAGKYEVKINQSADKDHFPLFLLYNPYYNSNAASNGTSAFVTIYNKISDENRDFGVDTGEGKNTRSGSRTGGF